MTSSSSSRLNKSDPFITPNAKTAVHLQVKCKVGTTKAMSTLSLYHYLYTCTHHWKMISFINYLIFLHFSDYFYFHITYSRVRWLLLVIAYYLLQCSMNTQCPFFNHQQITCVFFLSSMNMSCSVACNEDQPTKRQKTLASNNNKYVIVCVIIS